MSASFINWIFAITQFHNHTKEFLILVVDTSSSTYGTYFGRLPLYVRIPIFANQVKMTFSTLVKNFGGKNFPRTSSKI